MKQNTQRLIVAILLAVSLVLSGSLHDQQYEQPLCLAVVDPGSGGGTGGN